VLFVLVSDRVGGALHLTAHLVDVTFGLFADAMPESMMFFGARIVGFVGRMLLVLCFDRIRYRGRIAF